MAAGEDVQSEKTALGARLRKIRQQAGITLHQAHKSAGVSETTFRGWEQGHGAYRPWRAPRIAAALGVPVAQLFTDANVLAEITVSEATLADARNLGREYSIAAARRIADQLEPLIWEAATRRPVDTAPGARAKPRRTRAQVLAGVRAADRAARAARKRVSQAPAFTIPES